MSAILSEPVASTLVIVDERGGATLTEIAHATGRPLSTIQRAVSGLAAAGILVREAPRGPWRFAPDAPRRALREMAWWRLEPTPPSSEPPQVGAPLSPHWERVPRTIRDARIRAAWPTAIGSIVAAYRPERVILFGSQARGNAGPDSDVDLLVVFEGDLDRRKRQAEILRLLSSMPFPKDVLVATTADITRPLIGSALADAVREGVTVYGR